MCPTADSEAAGGATAATGAPDVVAADAACSGDPDGVPREQPPVAAAEATDATSAVPKTPARKTGLTA